MDTNLLKKVYSTYKNYGFLKTYSISMSNIKLRYRLYKEKQFDMKYGVETRHHIVWRDLKIESENKDYSFDYAPIPNENFYNSMKYLNIQYEEYVFIDAGAGKGRALLLASDFPFKEFIGIEFSKEIYEIAKNNIYKFKSMTKKNYNFKLLYMDAITYSFPNENIVLFLYNPFDGHILRSVLNNIRKHVETTEKDFIIIYHNPTCSDLFDNQSFLELKVSTKEYRIYGRNIECIGGYH